MSDFYRNGMGPNDPFNQPDTPENGRNPWQQQPDPFAAYDDPAAAGMPGTPQENDFSAWRRPASAPGPSFLTDEPFSMGAEMQQSGVPLPIPGMDDDFLLQGEDAPTRIAAPAIPQQLVSKRKTVDRGDHQAFPPPPTMPETRAPEENMFGRPQDVPAPLAWDNAPAMQSPEPDAAKGGEAPQSRSRRAGRMARYHEGEQPQQGGQPMREAAPPMPAPAAQSMPAAQTMSAPGMMPPPEAYGAPIVHGMSAAQGLDEGWQQRPTPLEEDPYRAPARSGFDPFEAGDNEIDNEPEDRPARRAAVPGERYTGARTAMPQSGAPIPRSKVGALPEEGEEAFSVRDKAHEAKERAKAKTGYEDDVNQANPEMARQQAAPEGRPPMRPQGPAGERPAEGRPPQRPQGQRPPAGPEGRPVRPQGPAGERPPEGRPPQRPQGQRPPAGPDGRPMRPQGAPGERPMEGRPAGRGAEDPRGKRPAPGRQNPAYEEDSDRYEPARRKGEDSGRYSAHASVKRPRYEFEDDEDVEVRRRGCLMPMLVSLLVVGVLLAGLLLPDWAGMNSGIGNALGGIKGSIVGVFSNVKSMVFPTEVRLTSFAVTPAEGTAPAELIFNVQTSQSVTDLRVVDDQGNVALQKTLTDADTLSGAVTKNSKGMIWTLHYTVQNEYQGNYRVQSLLKDGTWDEGMTLAAPVAIAAAPIPEPPVQGFECDTTDADVPATVGFTVQTSGDVVALRVVDDYGMTVVSHTISEGENETGSVVEATDSLTWELKADVKEAYEGGYKLEYQTTADLNFSDTDYSAFVELSEPVESTAGADAEAGDDALADGEGDAPVAQAANQGEAADGVAPVGEDVVAANAQADPEDAPPEASEAPQVQPMATPLPALTAQADDSAKPSKIDLKATLYSGDKTMKNFSRTKPVSILNAFNYAIWDQSGVLTFRAGPLRQNAAYGTVEVDQKTLTEVWKAPVGSKKLSKSTVYGIAWPGQPIIVKWPLQVRNLMNLNAEKKDTKALKEVILGAQDGKIYFLDLMDGVATRDPIDMGAPSGSGASLATNASPILGMGQTHSNLSGKQVDNGYHLYNLINGKEMLLLNGRDKAASTNYSGATGAALFDSVPKSTMVVAGQNGVLYTVELNDTFDYKAGDLKIAPSVNKYKTLAAKQDKKEANIDGSVAAYNNYVYYGDETGIVQCVDLNSLLPVWAVNTGDNVDATPALDLEGETLALYTGNTLQLQGKKGACVLRRLDGLSGKQVWEYTVPDLVYTTEFKIGLRANPVVGQNAISDLVIFTVTAGKSGSTVIALKKASGEVAWTQKLEGEAESSPVAVYNEGGDAWLVQAESTGKVHLMNAKTGEIASTLTLEGTIEASPAVYRDMLVIGTTGKDTSYIYGVKIQ